MDPFEESIYNATDPGSNVNNNVNNNNNNKQHSRKKKSDEDYFLSRSETARPAFTSKFDEREKM